MNLDPRLIQKLFSERPADDTASAINAWREREQFSQAEAAIKLGVSVRTLQGWELGRPMPYPESLSRGISTVTKKSGVYSLLQSDFPREFARFVDFVGLVNLEAAVRKADRKLSALPFHARSIFGDRYFFHEQCVRFGEGPIPFRIDLSDPVALRAAGLIVGINRANKSLSSTKASFRFRQMVIDNLKPSRDIRQIEHELRCSIHFGQKHFKVTFADLEGLGSFDLLVETPSGLAEVECKTVTEDTGSQIKKELIANLSHIFCEAIHDHRLPLESGVFTLKLNRPAAECKNIARQLDLVMRSRPAQASHAPDISISYSPRPHWAELLKSGRTLELRNRIALERADSDHLECIIASESVIALVVRPHEKSSLRQRLIETIKRGADQCTRRNPGVVWLHLSGVPQAEFVALAEFSKAGKGAGLNAIVAGALHPKASTTDRSHVQSVWFTAGGGEVRRHLTFAPDLLMVPAVSSSGPCYRVPNMCRFSPIADLA